MAITVPNQWTAVGSQFDVELRTLPTSGSWMIAVVAWRAVDGTVPQIAVADLPRNLWTLLGTSDNAPANTHIQVWACPKATFDGWSALGIFVAAMAISAPDVGTVTVCGFEVQGLSDAMTIDSVTVGVASAAATLSIATPAPALGANCLMVSAAAVDNAGGVVSVTSAGWTPLTQVTRSGPDVKMAPLWRASTTSQTASWSSTVNGNWVGIGVAIRETGVPAAQPNANYPGVQMKVGFGYDTSTPLQAVSFTPIVGDHLSTDHARGIQAELGDAQSEQSDLKFLDVFGALTSRPVVTAALSAAGTTTTAKILDAQAAGLVRGDRFRLWNNGALKATTVFQITAAPVSAGGTTTVTFSPAAATATASGDSLVTTPVDLYTPYRQEATFAGKTYPVCAGWTETLTQTWPSPAYSVIDAVAVDALAMLSTNAQSILRGEILRRSPYAYWPLDDAQGGGKAANASGVSQSLLVQTLSKFGAGASNSADFGAALQGVSQNITGNPATDQPSNLWGDKGTGWGQAGLVAAELGSKGSALVGSDPGFPAIANGVTICGFIQMAGPDINTVLANATVDPTVMILRNADPGAGVGQGSVIKLSLAHGAGATLGQAVVTTWDRSTRASTPVTAGSSNQPLASSLFLGWALVFDRTSWTCYVHGSQVATGAANLVGTFTGISIGGEADAFANTRFFNGLHGHVAVFGRKLSAQEILILEYAGTLARLAGETSDRNIQRKLNAAGWKGARVLSASSVSPATEAGDAGTVAAKASEIASYEDGLLFADAAGQIQFRSRQQSYQQSSRATLGDDTANGEIPFTRDASFSIDPSFVYNLIRIANTNQAAWVLATTTSVASDTVSAGKYQERPFDRATRVIGQADAFALACWLLARYAYPQRRISQLTIDAAAFPAAFPFVLGVEVGDLVTVNRRPIYEPATSGLYRVLHIAQSQAGAGNWATTLTLAVAPASSLVVGHPTKGVLGANSMAA